MASIAAITQSFTSKTDITAVLHNYLDDFNKNRPCLDSALDPAKSSFYLETMKEMDEDDFLAKATISRASFDAILAALPAVSTDPENADLVVHDRYRLLFYSSPPHLSSCLFFKGLPVVPVDAIFDVLHLLWCYTKQNPSRLRYLVDAVCVCVPLRLVFSFIRMAKRFAPCTPSTSPAEPLSVSSFGPNARCSYLVHSVSSGILLPTKSQGALEAELPVLRSASNQSYPAASREQSPSSKTYNSHSRPDLDNRACLPQTSSIAYSTRASLQTKKRKHTSPPSPPRKKKKSSRGKENKVVGAGRGKTSKKVGTSSKGRKHSEVGDIALEKDDGAGPYEASRSFSAELEYVLSKRIDSD